jgi:hypothetical protein
MNDMMKQCCADDGKPDFEKMKQFMQQCGKDSFGKAEIAMMKEFCCQEGMPSFGQIKEVMAKCGCEVPAWEKTE